jgi:hypothetical protein
MNNVVAPKIKVNYLNAAGVNFIKHFPLSLTTRPNKLDRLSLETLSSQVLEFASKVQML